MIRKRTLQKLCLILGAAFVFACTALLPAPAALAANSDLTISALATSPGSLPAAGGTVKLTGKITNNTSTAITNIALEVVSGNTTDLVVSSVGPNATVSFSMEGVQIAASDVGHQVNLNVTWSGGVIAQPFIVTLQTNDVNFQWSRTASSTTVLSGSTVVLTYNLKNVGTAPITNLKLTDSCVSGTIKSGINLNPGESLASPITTSIVVSANTASVPKVEYTAAGMSYSGTLDPLTITLGTSSLSIAATADKTQVSSGDTVNFTVTITNNSPVAVPNLAVTDDLGNSVKTGLNIAATTGSSAKTVSFSSPAVMTVGRAVSFTVTYPKGDGTNATATSAPVTISVLQAGSPLTLDVSASPVAMAFPGDVTFTVTVTNIGAQTITGIKISEPVLGDFGSILSLAPGGQQIIKKASTLSQPGAFTFTVTGKDPTNAAITPAVKQISVTSTVGSPTPQPTVKPASTDMLHTLFIVMVVIVSLIVIAGIVLLILIIQDRRKGGGGKRGRRNDWEDEDEDGNPLPDKVAKRPYGGDSAHRVTMEHTQPILRQTPGMRRAPGGDTPYPTRQGIVEEEESRIYGPEVLRDGKTDSEAPGRSQRLPSDSLPPRRRLPRNPEAESIEEPFDSDTNVTPRSRRSPMSEDAGEQHEVHLRYENEDDELPPFRPRRRR